MLNYLKGFMFDYGKSREMKERLFSVLDKQYEFEINCGYDEKIEIVAVGKIKELLKGISELQSLQNFCSEVIVETSLAFEKAELEGEYSSEKSSIGSILTNFEYVINEELNKNRWFLSNVYNVSGKVLKINKFYLMFYVTYIVIY